MDIISNIKQSLYNYLEKNFAIKPEKFVYLDVTLNTDPAKQQFGDISTNAALMLSKDLNTSPISLAENIKQNFTNKFVNKIEIAGPGFINIFLTQEAFKQLALDIFIKNKDYFKKDTAGHKNYSIEFVSANPTGPLHIGHGRGGIIGDVLGNILKFITNNITKEFYINDAGSQIQKLGNSLKIRCLQQLGQNIELPEDAYHGEYLINLAKKCIKEYGLNSEINIENKPQAFFSNYAKEQLLSQIKTTLENYGIYYDVWFSETELHKDGSIEKAIKKLADKNYIYQKDNALWFKSTEFGDDKDRVIKKSTGEYTYVAADIAYLENKINRKFNQSADQLIMVLGQDHHSYVKRLKGLMQALGYNPDRLDVILYQLVTIKESDKILRLSKRAGKIITLSDVIDTVGADVARFFYLNKKADAHLDFDLNLALKHTEENPVYYIQYAYVRTKSILSKAQQELDICTVEQEDYKFISESEYLLIKKIASLKLLLENMSKNYQIHLLTYYVIELAQAFHSYYGTHRVINKDNKNQSKGRLFTIMLIQRTLNICFKLLGISSPEHM